MIFGKPISELSFVEAVFLQAMALAFFIVVIDLTKSLIKRFKNFFAKRIDWPHLQSEEALDGKTLPTLKGLAVCLEASEMQEG